MPWLQSAVQSPSPETSGGCLPGQVCTVCSCVICLGARCLGSNWGLEVQGHPVLGSLHSPSTWRKVSFGWFPLPANLLGTSSQAHLFVMSLNVAKYNLGKVRLEGMQSAVSHFTVRDLRGGPLEICRAFWILLPFLCIFAG